MEKTATEPRSYLAEIERLKDLTYLPTHDEVVSIFSGYLRKKYQGNFDWYFDDLTSAKAPPHKFAEEVRSYEILNQEFIKSLANYLEVRIAELGGTSQKPAVIMEAGAGTGRLGHFLGALLGESKVSDCFVYHSTDSRAMADARGLGEEQFPVENMDYKEALEVIRPDIVITSWMVPGHDWTKDYRSTPSVSEYILVGKPGCDVNGACGGTATWTDPVTCRTDVIGGFARVDLCEVGSHQVGSYNDLYPYPEEDNFAGYDDGLGDSKTVAFRRILV